MIFCAIMLGIAIPYITNKISLDWMRIIPFFFLSVSGTMAVIGISHSIRENRWLEYIGRNSLVFYMFNTFALNISVKLFSRYMTSHLNCFLFYVAIMVLTLIILTILTKVLSTKYLKFTLGKF